MRKKDPMPAQNAARVILCLLILIILPGCREGRLTSTPVAAEALSDAYFTETPVPACGSLPNIKLEVHTISANSAQIRITGLKPYETVYTIFRSQAEDSEKKIECCPGETADENGVYEYSAGLRGSTIDTAFTNWEVKVIHSNGAACMRFMLPDP